MMITSQASERLVWCDFIGGESEGSLRLVRFFFGGCHQPPSTAAEELSTPAGQVSSGDPQQGPRQVAAQFEIEVDQELHLPAAYPQPIISLPSDSQPVAAHKPVTGDQEIYATACQISAGT